LAVLEQTRCSWKDVRVFNNPGGSLERTIGKHSLHARNSIRSCDGRRLRLDI